MGIALLGSMMLFGCRKIGETAPETASAGTSYVSEETAGESKTETKATETPAPTIVPSQTPALTQSSENKKIESPQPKATVRAVKKIKVAKVKGVKVTVTKAKKAKISWKKVKRAAGYRVMYSTDKKFKKAAVKITTKKANYVTKKLKKGKKYFIKVAAYRKDKAGKKVYGSFSAVKKIKVK